MEEITNIYKYCLIVLIFEIIQMPFYCLHVRDNSYFDQHFISRREYISQLLRLILYKKCLIVNIFEIIQILLDGLYLRNIFVFCRTIFSCHVYLISQILRLILHKNIIQHRLLYNSMGMTI